MGPKLICYLFIIFMSLGCVPEAVKIAIVTKNQAPVVPAVVQCPTNFLLVPGNAALGTSDFCVAKFHTKNSGGNPVVSAALVPWDNITSVDSFAKCALLNESGFNGQFALISNPEWMTIARNLELVSTNWSSGIVGTGQFVRGHSDGNPGNAIEVTNTNDPYDGTGNAETDPPAAGWNERRTFHLSNGNVIWDFSGNIWSWVDWVSFDSIFTISPTDSTPAYFEITSLDGSISHDDLQSAGGYSSAQGLGQWFGTSGNGSTVRGGRWGNGALAGIYSMYLDDTTSNVTTHSGFRCVYRP